MEHTNHMSGISYFPQDPLVELELMLYSSFLHEPCFYDPKRVPNTIHFHANLKNHVLFESHLTKSRAQLFYETANKAFDYDFQSTLELSKRGRKEFLMRTSPCELIAIGASHPKRVLFNKENPMYFRNIVGHVCVVPSDMVSILESWKKLNGSKSKFPTFLKNAFADILKSLKPYHLNKYRRACIDMIRLTHPKKTPAISELMRTGKLQLEQKDLKWETLMSVHGCWKKTMEELQWNMPHMAALRNIRGFAQNVREEELLTKYCSMLENGVANGKQFPFRYIVALESFVNEKTLEQNQTKNPFFENGTLHWTMVKNCIEACIQKSLQNHPKLSGDTFVLSDNSGSAWRTFTSTYGKCTIAEIGNISALITALSGEGKGVIGLFGDTLVEYTVDKNLSFLENYANIKTLSGNGGINVGGATENGIWLFFKRAMKNPEKYRYDNLFCYSDMQAGHGKLYGNDPEMGSQWTWEICNSLRFIHVPKLVDHYRATINRKLNVFTIQTAGYNDSIMNQSTYRGAMLSSWTGNEAVYAEKIIDLWDRLDKV